MAQKDRADPLFARPIGDQSTTRMAGTVLQVSLTVPAFPFDGRVMNPKATAGQPDADCLGSTFLAKAMVNCHCEEGAAGPICQ